MFDFTELKREYPDIRFFECAHSSAIYKFTVDYPSSQVVEVAVTCDDTREETLAALRQGVKELRALAVATPHKPH